INKMSKKEIFECFKENYPKLKRIGQNGIYQRLDSLIVGIEFEKSKIKNTYSPYFVLIGLWGKDVSNYRSGYDLISCLNSPDIHIRLKNQKGLPILLDCKNTNFLIEDVVDSLKGVFQLESDVSIKSIIKLIEKYKTHENIIGGSSGAMAILLEFKYLLSLTIEDINLQNSTLTEIKNCKNKWDMSHFELWLGNYDNWLNSLEKIEKKDIDKSSAHIINNDKILNLNSFSIV